MSAILTSTPEGAKLKKDLLATAANVGHILIERQRMGVTEYLPFTEIAH